MLSTVLSPVLCALLYAVLCAVLHAVLCVMPSDMVGNDQIHNGAADVHYIEASFGAHMLERLGVRTVQTPACNIRRHRNKLRLLPYHMCMRGHDACNNVADM